MNNTISRYYVYALLAYIIPIIGYICMPGTVGLFTIVQSLILYSLYREIKIRYEIELFFDKRIKLFALVIVFGVIHFLSKGKYDWISIALMFSSILGYAMIFFYVLVQDISSIRSYLTAFLLVLPPAAMFSAIFWDGFFSFDWPHILSPLALFFIITPFIQNKKLKYVIIFIYLLSAFVDTSVRACFLTGVICVLVLMVYKLTSYNLFSKISRIFRIVFLVLPITLLCLGIWADYNVFAEMEDADVSAFDLGSGRKSNMRSLNTDSRTVIYVDVNNSINGFKDIVIGKGEVINLETSWTDSRHSVEAGILNIFLKYGMIGCIVFFLIFWHSTKLGIYCTNNTFTQLIAIYLSYKFLYMFIEDGSINIATYIALGICSNESILNLTDDEIKRYFL